MKNFFILRQKGFSDIFISLSDAILDKIEKFNEAKKPSERLEKTFFEKLKKGESEVILNDCEYCHGGSNFLSPCLHCLGDQETNNFLKLLTETEDFQDFKKEVCFKEKDEFLTFPQMI